MNNETIMRAGPQQPGCGKDKVLDRLDKDGGPAMGAPDSFALKLT